MANLNLKRLKIRALIDHVTHNASEKLESILQKRLQRDQMVEASIFQMAKKRLHKRQMAKMANFLTIYIEKRLQRHQMSHFLEKASKASNYYIFHKKRLQRHYIEKRLQRHQIKSNL